MLTATLRPLIGTPIFEPALTQRAAHRQPSCISPTSAYSSSCSQDGYTQWPTEVAELHQRYADAPSARMRVLTRPAAVAAKLSTWADRAAPRDLYDLWALAIRGDVDADALALFAQHGQFTDTRRISFDRLPDREAWYAALGHQGRVLVGPDEASESYAASSLTCEDFLYSFKAGLRPATPTAVRPVLARCGPDAPRRRQLGSDLTPRRTCHACAGASSSGIDQWSPLNKRDHGRGDVVG